jgi:hypothetical protein
MVMTHIIYLLYESFVINWAKMEYGTRRKDLHLLIKITIFCILISTNICPTSIHLINLALNLFVSKNKSNQVNIIKLQRFLLTYNSIAKQF